MLLVIFKTFHYLNYKFPVDDWVSSFLFHCCMLPKTCMVPNKQCICANGYLKYAMDLYSQLRHSLEDCSTGWIVYILFRSIPGILVWLSCFFETSFLSDLVRRVFVPILNSKTIAFLCYEYSNHFTFIIT